MFIRKSVPLLVKTAIFVGKMVVKATFLIQFSVGKTTEFL